MPIRTYIATLAMLLMLAPGTASAAVQTREDPSDAPSGPSGKADLRSVAWDVGASSAKLTVGLDASTFGKARALIGVHVLIDTDSDAIADHEVVATRNADGLSVDVALRNLDRTLSTPDCQDLAGKGAGPAGTVTTTIAGGRETFSFSFDPTTSPRSAGRPSARRRPTAPPPGRGT